MTLISMCLSLMQEQMSVKAAKMAKRMGLGEGEDAKIDEIRIVKRDPFFKESVELRKRK